LLEPEKVGALIHALLALTWKGGFKAVVVEGIETISL
jgi:hypothetical protein